jgi:Ca-activated chloride channel family protein
MVGIGSGIAPQEINRIALAGQGNRRFLTTAADAELLVSRELTALSRVVARALRLRIKLAPGVKLLNILGSKRLDEVATKRVKEAEKSIDQRIAKNLGITADRGEDEDGVQIIIPTFFAGDAHVILMEVIVNNPGQVAEVTSKFKDLVQNNNGTARASIGLTRGTIPAGTLQLSVFKNALSYTLSERLGYAAVALQRGDQQSALQQVRYVNDLYRGLQQLIPQFMLDSDIQSDCAMLAEFEQALVPALLSRPEARNFVSSALQLAGRAKVGAKQEGE